jgi:hypothetical protein
MWPNHAGNDAHADTGRGHSELHLNRHGVDSDVHGTRDAHANTHTDAYGCTDSDADPDAHADRDADSNADPRPGWAIQVGRRGL